MGTVIRDAFRNNRALFIEVAAIGLLVFVLAVTIGLATGAPTGSVADWVAAVSTFAAFLAAGIAVHFAYRAYSIEEEREGRWAEQDRRSQAAQVAVWLKDLVFVIGPVPGQKAGIKGAKLAVRNASGLPVTDVEVVATMIFKNSEEQVERVLGRRSVLAIPPKDHDPIDLVLTSEAPILYSELPQVKLEDAPDSFELHMTFKFRDAAGIRWQRNGSGELRELAEGDS